ncbi:MAG: ATP-dependent helicase [Holosporales bacterium]
MSQQHGYLETLNPSQRQAVETTEGPLLVLAGAGTGKTRVLTTRIAHLLTTGKAWPSQILAVTFTNKAAHEMRERVSHILGRATEGLWLGTFHSICVRLLRRHAELVGLQSNFTILDTDDQLRLIKQIVQAQGIDDKRFPPRVILSVISRWKDRALTPEKIPGHEAGPGDQILEVYKEYQQRLSVLNAVDFGDLLMLSIQLLSKHTDIQQTYQNQFRYILVDEYQDTNVAQYLWLRLLTMGAQSNICCVGDDDQSIYGWRGAEVTNILRFEKDFPGAVVIRLEQNYRSTPHILAAASGLIAQNRERLGKSLWTERDTGEKVLVRAVWDGEEEARFIGDEVEALHRRGNNLSSMAVLVRAGFQTREFEDRFMTIGVPYRVVGGPRFYERQEIRDALAYLRVIVQPDDSLAFERIINTPRRGIGSATIQLLHNYARSSEMSLLAATRGLLETDELRGAAKTALRVLLDDFDRWRGQLIHLPADELAGIVLDESGYTAMWRQDKSPDAPQRLENLKELVNAIGEFETLPAFLEHIALVMESTEAREGDVVTVMTLHSAKGLEFDHVFLAGWEENLFPNPRALEETGGTGLEEERRLAYVGLTRAKTKAYITFAANRRMHGSWQTALPSRFLDELPRDHVEFQGLQGSAMRSMNAHSYAPRNTPKRDDFADYIQDFTPQNLLAIGDRVFHQKFGYGRVLAVSGDRLDVHFDHSGPKKVIASFVEKK